MKEWKTIFYLDAILLDQKMVYFNILKNLVSPAERLVTFERGNFRFWLQRFKPEKTRSQIKTKSYGNVSIVMTVPLPTVRIASHFHGIPLPTTCECNNWVSSLNLADQRENKLSSHQIDSHNWCSFIIASLTSVEIYIIWYISSKGPSQIWPHQNWSSNIWHLFKKYEMKNI